MMENKMAWQEGYEAGYAAAQEEIDKLTAERDAAVADLKELAECTACKHLTEDEWYTEPCTICGLYPWNDVREDKTIWEWRGLSLVSAASDKEVET